MEGFYISKRWSKRENLLGLDLSKRTLKFRGKERTFFKLGEVHENQDENLGPIPLFENVHLAAIFYSKTILTNVYLLCHVKSALYPRSAQESILAAPNSYCKYKAFLLSIFLLCV